MGELGRRLYRAEALLAAGCFATLLGLRWSLAERDAAVEEVRFASEYSRGVHWAGLSCRRYLDAVLGSRAPEKALPALREALRDIGRTRTLAEHVGLKDEADELGRMRRFVEASQTLLLRAKKLEERGKGGQAAALYRNGLEPLAEDYLGRSLEARLRDDGRRRSRTLADLDAWTSGAFGCAVAAMLLCFALMALWTHRFYSYLTANLERLRRAMAALASGNDAINVAPARDDEVGRLTAALGEMGERLRKTQARVVEIERQAAFGQLAKGAAHAINNPLAAVIGYAELLLQRENLEAHDRDDLRIIRDQARRCEGILRNLRQFTSGGESEKKPLDVNELVGKMLELLRPTLEAAGIALESRLENGLPPVNGSAMELQQVFYNLLTNACQALRGRRAPRVTVTTWSEAGQVCVAVDDDGEGIAREHLPRIFEPFFTTRAPTEGIGLGLSSAFGIIKEHGGAIAVRSEAGVGTRVQVSIPAIGGPGARSARGAGRGGLRGRVLVVDDEPEILALVSRVLRREGLDVVCVLSAREALDADAAGGFELVLSDFRMPGMDGVELYDQMCRRRPGARPRFLFSTGEIVSGEFQRFSDEHAIPVLLKPFDLDELVAVVRTLLDPAMAGREASRRERSLPESHA